MEIFNYSVHKYIINIPIRIITHLKKYMQWFSDQLRVFRHDLRGISSWEHHLNVPFEAQSVADIDTSR